MDEEQRQQKERVQELTRKEMYRKSRDLIRVYNPLSEPFKFMFDGYVQTIPAKSNKDIERYLANLYFRKISEKIINDRISDITNKLVEKKKATGNYWIDKYAENRELMTQVPRLDDPELLQKIHDDVWVGLVEEYGMEQLEETPAQQTADRRDVYERILGGSEKKVVDEPSIPTVVAEVKPVLHEEKPNEEEISVN